MSAVADLTNKLTAKGIHFDSTESRKFGYDLRIDLAIENVREFAEFLLENSFYLVHISGCHLSPRFRVTYEFASYDTGSRIIAQVEADRDGKVPTIADIYNGASWHERETRDFYGIIFDGNPDMRPLLLMESDVDFHPLLKKDEMLKSSEAVTWVPEPEKTTDVTTASQGAK